MLTSEELAAYDRDGYLVRRAVFDAAEVAAVAAETDALLGRKELMAQSNLRVRWQYHYETGDPIFELFDPVTDLSPRCDAWFRDARLLDLAGAVLRDRALPLKDKIIYKPAGAGGYPLHQDYIAWPSFPKTFLTIVIAIDAGDEENGCIELYPGAHAKGCLSELDGNFHMLPDSSVAGFTGKKIPLEPGDVLMFGGYMPHRSEGNRSQRRRRHLLYSYNAERDGGDLRRDHYEAFHHWLRTMYGAMGLGDLYFR